VQDLVFKSLQLPVYLEPHQESIDRNPIIDNEQTVENDNSAATKPQIADLQQEKLQLKIDQLKAQTGYYRKKTEYYQLLIEKLKAGDLSAVPAIKISMNGRCSD